MRSLFTRVHPLGLAAVLCLASVAVARAQAPYVEPTPTPPIPSDATLQQLMTPEQFKAAGLKKLSSAELSNLNDYLRGMRAQSERAAVDKVVPPPSRYRASEAPLIQSRVAGEFKGLTGRTRIMLENGQIWQQSNDSDKFKVQLDHPAVVMAKSFFGYQMMVIGYSKPFYVKQIIP